MNIIYTGSARKFLERQNNIVRERIIDAIERLPDEGDVKKLKGGKGRRLRVGIYRVVFDVHDKTVYVYEIDTRGHMYRGGR